MTNSSYGETIGPLGSQIRAVEGDVKAATDSSLTMAVTEVARTASDDEEFHGQPVVIPLRDIGGIEQKRENVARSTLLAGLIGGAALWIGSQLGKGGANPSPGPTPGPQQ